MSISRCQPSSVRVSSSSSCVVGIRKVESFLKPQDALNRKRSRVPSGNIVGNDEEVYLHQISIKVSREKESLLFLAPETSDVRLLKD
jgi:hypothetical protein